MMPLVSRTLQVIEVGSQSRYRVDWGLLPQGAEIDDTVRLTADRIRSLQVDLRVAQQKVAGKEA